MPTYTFGGKTTGKTASIPSTTSMSSTTGTVLGGIGSAVGSIVGAALNYQAQKNNLKWQKEQWGQVKRREDSAHQREVRDLRLAGLSPTLSAGGSGASSMQAISTQAPQFAHEGVGNAAQEMMQLLATKKQIDKTEAEIKLLGSQRRRTNIDASISSRDHKLNKLYGTHSQPSTAGKWMRDASVGLDNWIKHLKNTGKKLYQREKRIWKPYIDKFNNTRKKYK